MSDTAALDELERTLDAAGPGHVRQLIALKELRAEVSKQKHEDRFLATVNAALTGLLAGRGAEENGGDELAYALSYAKELHEER